MHTKVGNQFKMRAQTVFYVIRYTLMLDSSNIDAEKPLIDNAIGLPFHLPRNNARFGQSANLSTAREDIVKSSTQWQMENTDMSEDLSPGTREKNPSKVNIGDIKRIGK